MSIFNFDSMEHALASVAHDTVVAARATAIEAGKTRKAAPEIEAVTGLIDPQAIVIERAAFAALGSLAKAASDTAASAEGVNVPLDEATINDYKQVYQMLAAKLQAQSQTVSTSAAAVPTTVPVSKGAYTLSDQLRTPNVETPANGNTDLQAAAGKEKQ